MTKFTHDILEKIKKDHIEPRPKWYFALMHALLWLSVIVTIFLGALAVAITLRHLLSAPWDLLRVAVPNRLRAFTLMLPYVWLAFIGLTVLLSTQLFKHTKKGYRMKPVYVVLGSISLSLILGAGLYFVKADQPVEDRLKDLPAYEQWQEKKQHHFYAPEKGLISGKIIELVPHEELTLMDVKRSEWQVHIDEARSPELFVGKPVVIMGEDLGNHHFQAEVVKFIHPPRRDKLENETTQFIPPEKKFGTEKKPPLLDDGPKRFR